MDIDLSERHPSTQHIAQFFDHDHLPSHLAQISAPASSLAELMITSLPDGPELTQGLRFLLQAKDCFVRQALLTPASPSPTPASAPA